VGKPGVRYSFFRLCQLILWARLYVDKLDGLADTEYFEKMSNQWRDEQNRCLREIERHQEADKSYMDEGVQLL
jgi:site-specific DNA recombinase